jgi:hypothetical protein
LAVATGPVGCGQDSDNTTTSSEQKTSQAAAAQRAKRIHQLKRRVARLKQEARKERLAEAKRDSTAQSKAAAPATGRLAGLETLGRQLGAKVGGTLGPPGSSPTAVGGSLQTGSAWSTIKVPIAIRVLDDAGGPSELSAGQRDLISRAITASDNEAAAELFSGLERKHGGLSGASTAVTEVLRSAGDATTVVSTQGRDGFSTYGQTEWSLPLQHQFIADLVVGCITSPASTDYLLGLMRSVTSDQWGLGSAGVPALWKGGWGPGTDGRYLLRQMGAMTLGGKQVIVTLAVRPDDGQYASGQTVASEVAQFLAQRAPRYAGSSGGC